MDWQAIIDSIPAFAKAMQITLFLETIGIALSLVFGFIFALTQYFKIPVVHNIVHAYIEFARNTPLLIQLFFLYFGLPKIGIPIGKETAATIGLAFSGSAYMAEAFRGSFRSIRKVQIESGKALGFSRWLIAKKILLPQALPLSIPSLGVNCIALMKDTSLFSGIAILDLTNTARDLISMKYLSKEYLLVLVVAYLLLIVPLILFIHWIEKRMRYADVRI